MAQCYAADTSLLRIATYNVQNFFDRYDDPYTLDARVDNSTTPKSARQLWALANVLRGINADIVALQEVENRGCLEEFNKSYLGALRYKYVVLIEGNSSHQRGRGIDVALLSRVPVSAATTYQYREFPVAGSGLANFSRDFLHVTLRPAGWPEIHMFVVHTISRSGEIYAYRRRIAEAQEASRILSEVFAGQTNAWIIVAGDFNDSSDSESVKTLLKIPTVPLAEIPARDSAGKSFTYYGSDQLHGGSPLDHILVSRAVAAQLASRTATIVNDKNAAAASDHRPVIMVLKQPSVNAARSHNLPAPASTSTMSRGTLFKNQ